MKKQIYRILDVENFSDVDTGATVPYLSYERDGKVLSKGGSDATLEELVGLCDQDAEDRNAHDFCGVHRLLAAVLFRQHGRKSATETLLMIALFGGLQGMAGICTKGDAYAELNLGKAGHDWSGKFE